MSRELDAINADLQLLQEMLAAVLAEKRELLAPTSEELYDATMMLDEGKRDMSLEEYVGPTMHEWLLLDELESMRELDAEEAAQGPTYTDEEGPDRLIS